MFAYIIACVALFSEWTALRDIQNGDATAAALNHTMALHNAGLACIHLSAQKGA